MVKITATEVNGRPALVAADLIARQRADGLWSVYVADSSVVLTGAATEAEARLILADA